MAAEPLAKACEAAFEVAKRGAEANPPLPVPAAMRSFLYVPQLPRRAVTVARRVLDEDPAFRARVAAVVTEAEVGRAGYLWLHRPTGWEAEFTALTSGEPAAERAQAAVSPGVSAEGPAAPMHRPEPPVGPEPIRLGGPQDRVAVPSVSSAARRTAPAPRPTHDRSPRSAVPSPPASTTLADADASRESIEAELASLRGLVDRLAEERMHVGSSVESLETEVVERRAESRTLAQQLEANGEDLVRARAERDEAFGATHEAESRRQQAEWRAEQLRTRVEELEAELAASRDRIEAQAGVQEETASTLSELRTDVGDLRQRLRSSDEVQAELWARLEQAEQERQRDAQDLVAAQTERDRALDRLRLAEQARADLEAELADVSSRWQALRSELEHLNEQRLAVEAELDRLDHARQTSQAERRVLFDDLAGHLGRVEAERNLLAAQLELAQARLSGTRQALETATRSIGGELGGTEAAFGETSRAARAVDAAVAEISDRLDRLGTVIDDEHIAPVVGGSISDTPHAAPASGSAAERDDEEDALAVALAAAVERVAESDEDGDEEIDEEIVDQGGGEDSGIGVAGAEEGSSFGEEAEDMFPPSAEAQQMDPWTYDPASAVLHQIDEGRDAEDMRGAGEDHAGSDGPEFPAGAEPVADPTGDHALSPSPIPPPPPSPSELDEVLAYYGLGAESLEPPSEAIAVVTTGELPAVPAPPPPPGHVAPPSVGVGDARVEPVEPVGHATRLQVPPFDGTPIEYARHVVNTPDIILVIDGDPAADMGWPSFELLERRNALVQNLGELVATTGAAPDVVFDGGRGADLPDSLVGRVRLHAPGQSIDRSVLAVLGSYPEQWPVAVVTDSSDLAYEARGAGAAVLDSGQLLDLFI